MFQLLLTSVKRKEKLNPAIRSEGIKWAKQVERPFLLLFCLKSLKRKGFQQNWPKTGKPLLYSPTRGTVWIKKTAKFKKEPINMLYYFLEMFTNRTAHSQQSVSVPLPITECMC